MMSLPSDVRFLCRANRDRVAAKFVENEFEKADRLMELFFQYQASWQSALQRLKAGGEDDAELIEVALQDAGQFMIRQVCFWRLTFTTQLRGARDLLAELAMQSQTELPCGAKQSCQTELPLATRAVQVCPWQTAAMRCHEPPWPCRCA